MNDNVDGILRRLTSQLARLAAENARLREALVVLYGWTPEGVQGFIDAASLSETGGEG